MRDDRGRVSSTSTVGTSTVGTTGTGTAVRPEFVDLYDQHLGPLWRFVRSRVPDPYAAEDLTAEVFSRAWKGWARFDPDRGSAAAWLFGIAHHVVADWWRHRATEFVMEASHEPDRAHVDDGGRAPAGDPADEPLRREATERVAAAVAGLSERDRDALALRYGGGLAVADVATVLELSMSAAKMTISRALERLREVVVVGDADVTAHDLAPTLASLLDDTRSRLAEGGDPALLELVAHLAVVHDHDVPEELPGRIAACIGCREYAHLLRDGELGQGRRPGRPAMLASIWLLLGVTCVVCTLPVLWPLISAAGLSVVSWIGHDLGLLVSPVVFWIVRRQSRRHGDRLPARLAAAGMSLLLVHAALHFSPDNPFAEDGGSIFVTAVWTFADWAGSGLLLAGVLAHWRSLEHWLRAQRTALVERVATRPREPARLRPQG